MPSLLPEKRNKIKNHFTEKLNRPAPYLGHSLEIQKKMSASQEVPPWLREQLVRFEQLQQNLQAIVMQKQQVDLESAEVDRALVELKKTADTDSVYKSAGNILVKAKKEDLLKELEERKELANTRSTVLAKQEARVRENIKDLQSKIEEALKGKAPTASQAS
jgi:prefoldin beta subunit